MQGILCQVRWHKKNVNFSCDIENIAGQHWKKCNFCTTIPIYIVSFIHICVIPTPCLANPLCRGAFPLFPCRIPLTKPLVRLIRHGWIRAGVFFQSLFFFEYSLAWFYCTEFVLPDLFFRVVCSAFSLFGFSWNGLFCAEVVCACLFVWGCFV